ncbi:MAG: Hsp70 family protein [Cyanobacteria bacterium J06638_22]
MYAIDFGTSNTVVCRWNAATNAPETLSLQGCSQKLSQNPPLVPSLLYVENATTGQSVLGQQVRDRGLDITTDARFFRNFKRGIGTDIRGFLPELDGQTVTFEQAGKWFLEGVIRQLQQQEETVESLVITVPVDSFEAYRLWLAQVCQSLQVEQVRMLDEPTAAALGYGLQPGSTVLVVDFGGGTLDLSLVQLEASPSGTKPIGFLLKWGKKTLEDSAQRPQVARVRGKAGQNLGGADIDNWLVDYFAKEQGIPLSPLTLRLAERLKIQLSTKREATEAYFDDETLATYELHMERDRFQTLLDAKGFFQRLDTSMTQVLRQGRQQGIEVEDIDAVLLVGGTAQIPAVQTWASQYFPQEKIQAERPFEAIAHGALQLNQGMEVKDFLYHSYGIRYWDRRNNRHGWHPIVNEGQPYPMERPVELFLGASLENQPSIELVLGELGRSGTTTEVYFEGDRLVTRTLNSAATTVKPLNDSPEARSIAALTPPGQPGSDRIKVLFRVDGDRFLRITVEDLFTGETLMNNRPVVQLS